MAEKIRDYAKLAADIKKEVGESNIVSATHCATRLRLVLKDSPDKAVTDRISSMPAVIQVVEKGGQYQIVIGTHAKDVYEELAKTLDVASDAPPVKQGILERIIATMSAVFAPFVYVLAAAGLLQGILIIITTINPAFSETGTYAVLNFVSWAPFTFLPAMIAITASKHFKCNTYLAVWCCLALVSSDWGAMAERIAGGETITFLMIPMSQTTYTSTVLPPLFLVWILSYLERGVNKILPDVLQSIVTPLICALIMVPLTILAIGPITNAAAEGIAVGYNYLVDTVPVIAAILVGGIWEVFVIFGVHWGVTPMVLANFDVFGYDTFQAFQTCAVVAQAAACFGVVLRTRQKKMKNMAFSAGLTGIFGITEPAIYGVTLALKKPFIYGCVGGAIGAIVVSLFQARYYVYAGLPGLLTIMNAISPDQPSSFTGMLIGVLATIVVTILLTVIFGIESKDEPALAAEGAGAGTVPVSIEETANGLAVGDGGSGSGSDTMDIAVGHGEAGDTVTIYAPLNGTAKKQSEINDPTFAEGILGQGAAIVPVDGKLYAPFDCEVFGVTDTGHAINLIGPGGIEMLIHIGIDTVELGGKGFKTLVKEGQHLKAGDLMIEFDLDTIGKDYETITAILITNADEFGIVEQLKSDGTVQVGDPLLLVKK
ncbi:MAG: PTS transporter subunit EIIC [Clostridia bacterium]|nr:PTS transporter subunit EIIC [Clostridia bacterium]